MTTTQQVALVTGASSGIGKATATAFADAGYQVIGTSRNTARLTAPAGVTHLDLDVTDDESVASVVKQVIDRYGRIDVLVNNAGVGANGAGEEFSLTRTHDVFDINVYGVMRMTKAVLPHMRARRRGRVINVSSLSGFVPSPFMAIYTSTKHAVEGYSGSLDHEVREHGVRILLVEPGPINTPFGDHSIQGDTPMPLYAPGRKTFDEVLTKLSYPMVDDRTTTRTDIDPRRLRSWSQHSNRFGWRAYLGPAAADDNVPHLAAPARYDNLSGPPPAWIGVGTNDLFHDEDVAYAGRLQQAGVASTLHVVPGAYHAFDSFEAKAAVAQEFFRAQTKALDEALNGG